MFEISFEDVENIEQDEAQSRQAAKNIEVSRKAQQAQKLMSMGIAPDMVAQVMQGEISEESALMSLRMTASPERALEIQAQLTPTYEQIRPAQVVQVTVTRVPEVHEATFEELQEMSPDDILAELDRDLERLKSNLARLDAPQPSFAAKTQARSVSTVPVTSQKVVNNLPANHGLRTVANPFENGLI